MKGLLKNLGIILILIGAAILIGCAVTGNVNDNTVMASSVVLIVAGLLSYIIINKKITD